MTGYFNVAAGSSEPYDTLVSGADLLDTWTVAEEHRTKAYATFHGYGPPAADGDRIDWILVRPTVRVLVAGINTRTVDGRWPSDHWPVQSLLQLG